MLQWSTKSVSNDTKFCSRIPVSRAKRSDSFKRKEGKLRDGFLTGVMNSDFENMTSVPPLATERNIGVDVFDWLNECSKHSDKYTKYSHGGSETEGCISLPEVERTTYEETTTTFKKENQRIVQDIDVDKTMDRSGEKAGTKSYFNALRSAFFPFEGKYFYLSGEVNKQTVLVKATTTSEVLNVNNAIPKADKPKADKASCDSERYEEILGDKSSDNDINSPNKQYINGLKDTNVYSEGRQKEIGNEHLHFQHGYDSVKSKDSTLTPKINLKSEVISDSQQEEINRLRTQVEKLSAFVESSEERREQSESLLAQHKEQLLKHIDEKEALENRVCCLEELRRNLQVQVEETCDENTRLKIALKSSEDKLMEEKEQVKVLKKECSVEIKKNVELELVLQTIREELGCASSTNYSSLIPSHDIIRDRENHQKPPEKQGEKKVHWGSVETQEIEKPTCDVSSSTKEEGWERSKATKIHYSCLKHHGKEEYLWRSEKQQFEGKILLLEMDKTKMRSQIEQLEAKILKQENIAQNLRENNEVLEFRVLELEYELVEKARK